MNKLRFLSLVILVTHLFFTDALLAQAPQGIPYQAIARNASGQAIASTAVKVRFSIRDSIATGAIKYQETHNPTTSALGLFSVNVGMGTVVSGTFSGINWGKNAKFLQVELNTNGGTTYTDLGTTQMMSVPYALYSKSSGAIKMRTSPAGDTLYNGGEDYVIIPGISNANLTNYIGGILTDIDGNTYQTVTIGNQTWMKENLKVSRYRNGDTIFTNLNDSQWDATTIGAYAIYNNDPANNSIYGKLYNLYAVADSRGLCPYGWHVPSDNEWYILENYLDPSINNPNSTIDPQWRGGVSGAKMKTTGTIESGTGLWFAPNKSATNSSDFSAQPGGFRSIPNGGYQNLGVYSIWHSSVNPVTNKSWSRLLAYTESGSYRSSVSLTQGQGGISVRCLKD